MVLADILFGRRLATDEEGEHRVGVFAGIASLSRAYGIGATEPGRPGYESILSQLVAAVVGRGTFYYVTIGSVLSVLALSANTGFAAHPMTSDLGQGACQAIEDAVVLADCLARTGDVAGAPRASMSCRIPRTSRVVRESRRAGTIAQWSNPLACRFVDFGRRCRAPVTSSESRPSSSPG